MSGLCQYLSPTTHAYGQFRRVVPLPSAVLSDQAKAVCKDGVLRVELPKALPAKPRRLVVPVN